MPKKKWGYLRLLGLPWLLLIVVAAHAQSIALDPDWKETEVPAPPKFSRDQLLALDMPHFVSVQFGIDPSTIAIGPDGIVRYVVIASNASGSYSAMYEGIRCATDQVKTYARASGGSPWRLVDAPEWRGLTDNQPSRHAWVFARQAACDGRVMAASSVATIVKALKK